MRVVYSRFFAENAQTTMHRCDVTMSAFWKVGLGLLREAHWIRESVHLVQSVRGKRRVPVLNNNTDFIIVETLLVLSYFTTIEIKLMLC